MKMEEFRKMEEQEQDFMEYERCLKRARIARESGNPVAVAEFFEEQSVPKDVKKGTSLKETKEEKKDRLKKAKEDKANKATKRKARKEIGEGKQKMIGDFFEYIS